MDAYDRKLLILYIKYTSKTLFRAYILIPSPHYMCEDRGGVYVHVLLVHKRNRKVQLEGAEFIALHGH